MDNLHLVSRSQVNLTSQNQNNILIWCEFIWICFNNNLIIIALHYNINIKRKLQEPHKRGIDYNNSVCDENEHYSKLATKILN